MKRMLPLFLLLAALTASGQTLLPQQPALNKTHIVFVYAGDLWSVPRQGGAAVRLTASAGIESNPVFTPDGATIAFSGSYDGNQDVFTIPAAGGVPKRLTSHPSIDVPRAFAPDGKRLLILSGRAAITGVPRFFTISIDGGPADEAPLPSGFTAAYSPDGQRLAYTPLPPAFTIWKRYRGGRTSKIWLAHLSDSKVEEIPRENSNDFNPVWAADAVFFLSDRNGPVTLFRYDLKSRKVTEAIRNTGLDYKSASLGPGAIVLERFGGLELYDLKSGKATPVKITLEGDMPGVRPSFEGVGTRISHAALSPTGARAVFEARGDIFTVPAEKGDVRNHTMTPGVAERMPSWSPDGQKIAYFSDESGEYELHIGPQSGIGGVKKIGLGGKAFFYYPEWSPDSRKILFRDSMLNVCYVDVDSGKVAKVDADYYDSPYRDEIAPKWSPDSKWIVYTKQLPNHLRAVHVYSLETGQKTQVSDGLSDARYAAFDKGGRHLFFTASTNQGLGTGWLDMSSQDRIQTRSVYAVVLRADDPSPLAPESDEEKGEAEKKEETGKAEAAKKDAAVRIDLEGISQRILALPVPARSYSDLVAGKSGMFYLLEDPPAGAPRQEPPSRTVHKFDMKMRKLDKVLEGVREFIVSFNGEKMLYRQGQRWAISGTAAAPRPNEGTIRTAGMEMRVDPPAEWKQMYREAWRIQRDFLYAPNYHGLDLAAAEKKYEPYLAAVAHRADLNYLFAEMLGEISVGHLYVSGGALPPLRQVQGGLLGADYERADGRYRFAKVYDGENWNPNLRAPLTQPGVNVKAGEYLIEVNGREVRDTDDVYAFFEATADKSVRLKVGPNANGEGAREVTVVPVANEQGLRYMDWVEGNRRKVEQLSGGRLGYVHLPNTAEGGYTNFNRWVFAQMGKEGFVLDERFNGGGQIADYIVDLLRRPLLSYFTTRAGNDFTTPMNGIFGPKAMIINEFAGSGGDAMPWMFRQLKIGPLIGKRTWGGLVGIFGFPELIDGGRITAPNLAFYNLQGEWEIENWGVAPDIEVDQDPALVRQGRDPQLEKAVEVVLEELKKNPPVKHRKPAYPDYHNRR